MAGNVGRDKRRHEQHKYRHRGAARNDQAENSAALKKNIRDAKRILLRSNVTATQRQELERRVKASQLKLNQLKQSRLEKKLYTKYKYLRFVEQKKVQRKIVQAKSKLRSILNGNTASQKTSGDDGQGQRNGQNEDETRLSQLRDTLDHLELQMAYIRHYPVDKKYLALFPSTPDPPDAPSTIERAEIMAKIKSALDQGLFNRPGFVLRIGTNADQVSDVDSDAASEGESDVEEESEKHNEDMEDASDVPKTTPKIESRKRKTHDRQSTKARKDPHDNPKDHQKKSKKPKMETKEKETDDFFA